MSPALIISRSLTTNWRLLINLARVELRESVAGNALGWIWIFLAPLLTMAIYIFVFAVVFQIKLPATYQTVYGYPAYILAGLIPWLMSVDIMSKSCSVLIGNAGIVKEIVFPIEVLPAKVVFASLVTFLVPYSMFFMYAYLVEQRFLFSHLALPIVIGLQLIFLIGLSLTYATITPFFREWTKVVGIVNMLLIYMAPIVYISEWVPPVFKPFVYINPFTYMALCFHDVLFYGYIAHPYAWIAFTAIAIGTYVMGSRLFYKAKSVLGNVI